VIGESNEDNLTLWLRRMSDGDTQAADIVASTVYRELRRVAHYLVAHENRYHSLQPTILINEAFLRLMHGQPVRWEDRHHFFKVAARMMRRILIDYFRDKGAQKRLPSKLQMSLDDVVVFSEEHREEVLMVDEALRRLSEWDRRAADVVELRYFGGLSTTQIADVLNVADRTVKRDWQLAQAWLKRYFDQSAGAKRERIE
jgi:RNA polymerase sigma factor (TIGR02999 family)